MVKKNDFIELEIKQIDFPNRSWGIFDDAKITVKNTIPGQKVLAKINKKRNGNFEGRLEAILQRADYEIEPACSHFGLCGSCIYQSIPYEIELEFKKKQVLKLLDDAKIKDYEFLGINPSPVEKGYRNKCEFSFGDEQKGGNLALGMRKRQSFYEVITLKDCNIVDSDYLKIIDCVLNFFKQRDISFYHKMRHDGILRHLVVRKSYYYKEILINLVTVSNINFSIEDFKNKLLKLKLDGEICGILHTENDSIADVVKSDNTVIIYGRDYFIERLFELDFKITAFSFFQTNSKGAEKLYSIVCNFAGDIKNKIIFDLYCGTGTIGQIMSLGAKKVIGIELIEEAVFAANENAKLNNIENCEFIAGDVLKKIDELTLKPDIIILDPPRDGIHSKVINKIIDFNADEIIYVSCKASSLTRDLIIFEENGYKTLKVEIMDMFPRTANIETVCLLSKRYI